MRLTLQTVWQNFKDLTSTDIYKEFINIGKTWNDHDSGAIPWNAINANRLIFGGNGTTTNAAGYVIGTIPQIVSTPNTGTGSTSSASFAALQNGNAIIPKASTHQVLLVWAGQLGTSASGVTFKLTFFRNINGGGASNIGGTEGLTEVQSASGGATNTPGCVIFLDSPATTLSTVYSLYGKVSSGSGTIADTNQQSNFYAIEIAQ